ncbi:MAG: hypothetical protein WBG38_20420 [Nodosilinea sp.]
MRVHYLGALAIAGLIATGTVACSGANPCAGSKEQVDSDSANPCAADPCAADPCAGS